MNCPLSQEKFKNQTIVEQQIVKKKLYIITTDKSHEKYTLWLNNKKLGKADNPIELYEKIK